MRKSTLLVVVVVAAAAFLLWKKKEEEKRSGGPGLAEAALFPALRKDAVRSVRIDNLERSVQVKLERDAAGSWFVTDPVAYPATDGLVRTLLLNLELAKGEPETVLAVDQVDLDPPKVVLELVQIESDGERTLRLEIGGLDLDPGRVFVRVPDHAGKGEARLFRAVRTLYTTLERNPDDYRERRATHLRAHQVTAFRRSGEVFLADRQAAVDMTFQAQLDERWVMTGPERAFVSAEAILLLARGAAELTVDDFLDDAPDSFARWGLDPPAFTVELRDLENSPTVLHFGHLPVDATDRPVEELAWTCRREGFAHVWRGTPKSVDLLTRPAEDLLEYRLLSAFREDVRELRLRRGGRTLFLDREGRDGAWKWFVSEAQGAEDEPLRYRANPAAVADALALIEGLELGTYPGREGVTFDAGDEGLGFVVRTARGERFEGELGVDHVEEGTGIPGHLFRFPGTELCGFAPAELAELCRRPLDELRSLRIFGFGTQSLEAEVRQIELERRGETRAYVNDGRNLWTIRGRRTNAPGALVGAIDRGLLTLRARAWLAPDPDGERAAPDEIWVRLRTIHGQAVRYTLGRDAEGRAYCRTEEGQLAEIAPDCLAELEKLFGD